MKELTAIEKAKELVDSFIDIMPCLVNQTAESIISYAKQCALIAVDEILNTCVESVIYYYQDVKSEIEKI